MTKRERKPVLTPVSAAEAEELMAIYAQADAEIEQMQAKMDAAITKIRDQYAPDIQLRQQIKDEQAQKLQLFAETNKGMFDKKRSMDMAHGRLGFRTGTPKVDKRKGFTWAAVTEMMKEFLPDFVRTKEEPNKEMVIEKWGDKQFADGFEKCGISVIQEETFFVELKKEENAKGKAA